MSAQYDLRELARADTRQALAASQGFRSLSVDDQRDVYRREYQRRYDELARQMSAPAPRSGPSTSVALAEKASDMIDDQRHLNQRIDQAGQLAGDFVREVDFPGFVRDLLKGVFDANLEVTLTQMSAYQELLKTATASVSKFVNAIDDTAAFGYLAENNSDEFGLDFGEEKDENGQNKMVLTRPDGEPVDIGDNQVKAKIMEAKIRMAQEQRALLRETILMGITRLVVERGNVKASVLFDIKASERVEKQDKAALKDTLARSHTAAGGTGLIGKIFGGGSAGTTTSRSKTKISVSSARSQASTDLQAKLAGSVDITFKSDYFELNRFADMYGPVGGAAGGAAPAAGAPAPASPPAARA
ncbi:hypothetical protein ACI79C_14135 [Geodermatophilus sp. SYSU D00697]